MIFPLRERLDYGSAEPFVELIRRIWRSVVTGHTSGAEEVNKPFQLDGALPQPGGRL